MAINIPEARIKQVTETITRFCEDFAISPSDPSAAAKITSLCDPEIHWYDHGFYICRVGHTAILGLHKAFLHCNQQFQADIKGIHLTADGGVVEQVWRGKCANDIVRPDGSIIMKGSGKDFTTHICMVLKISNEGKIQRIDEYWDEGVGEEHYKVMKGESLKQS